MAARPFLPDAYISLSQDSQWTRIMRATRKHYHKCTKAIMRSHRLRIPKYDMPLRFRPWFLLFTCIVMLILALLGFTNFSRSLPLNDKLLHFLCLALATGIFYFIFDVEEDARRIWFWRTAPLIFTGVICFFFGGLVSEFVQSMLPHKEFQFGDVVANLLGSSVGLYTAYYIERYYRHRREISRLYRPLDTDYAPSDSEDEDDVELGAGVTQLLPLHTSPVGSSAGNAPKTKGKTVRLADVWNEGEELFDIGDDSDDDGDKRGTSPAPAPGAPKIVVTGTEP